MGFWGRLFSTKKKKDREQLESSDTSASTDNTDEDFVCEPETDTKSPESKKMDCFLPFRERKKQVKKSEKRKEEVKETTKNTSEENEQKTQAKAVLETFETHVDDEMENRKKDTGRPDDKKKFLKDEEVTELLSNFVNLINKGNDGSYSTAEQLTINHYYDPNDPEFFEEKKIFLLRQENGKIIVLLSPTGDEYNGEDDYQRQLAEFKKQYEKEHSGKNLDTITFAVPYNLKGETEESNHWVMKYGIYDMSEGQIIEVKEANSLANGKQTTDSWSCGYHTVKACAELATYGYEKFNAMEQENIKTQQEKTDEEYAMQLSKLEEMQAKANALWNETEQPRYESIVQSPETDWSWSDGEKQKKTEQLDPSTFDAILTVSLEDFGYTSISFEGGTDSFTGLVHQNEETGKNTVILPASNDEDISRNRMKQIKESEFYRDSQVTFVMPYFQNNQWQVTVVNHNKNLDNPEINFQRNDGENILNLITTYAEGDRFDDFILAVTPQSQIIHSKEKDEKGYKYCYIKLSDGRSGFLYAGMPTSGESKEEQIHCLTEAELEISPGDNCFFRHKNANMNEQTHFYMRYVTGDDNKGCSYVPLELLANRGEQGVTGWYSFPELSVIEKIGTREQEKEERIEKAKRNIGIALGGIKPVSENTENFCYHGGVPQNRNNQHEGRN